MDKSETVVFLISGLLVNPLEKIYLNSRTSNHLNMKLGPVTKTDKRNAEVDVLSANNDIIVIFRFMTNPKVRLSTHGLLTSAKLSRSWYQKVCFRKLHMCVYLHTNVQVSSIIKTSSRQGVTLTPPRNHHHYHHHHKTNLSKAHPGLND